MNTCPCCGHPIGNRGFAPRNGTAPCVDGRYTTPEYTWAWPVVALETAGRPVVKAYILGRGPRWQG